jgi:hypothetical protein
MLRWLRSCLIALPLLSPSGYACRPAADDSAAPRSAPVQPRPASPGDSATKQDPPTQGEEPPDTATEGTPPDSGAPLPSPRGFVGSPCVVDADCSYEGGQCLREDQGYPRGTCSAPCADWCDDLAGHPTTSCVDALSLPSAFAEAPGACLSRCDFGIYPQEGCRSGYGCARVARADPALLDVFACLPLALRELDPCRSALAEAGVSFEPQVLADDHPSDQPQLTCHVEAPVRVGPTVGGVALRYLGQAPARVLVDCETAGALVASGEDVAAQGVTELHHLGTYSCRTIAGTSTLSQHGLGRALDVQGFGFADGSEVTVYDDWEDGDPTPTQWAGQFLYDTIHRWYDRWIWNILLTPEYNAAHDDHFHVDLTEGDRGLSFGPDRPRHLGPFPPGQVD